MSRSTRNAHRPHFFDRLSRRAAVIGGGASLAALGVDRTAARQATPVAEATERVRLLFIQQAGATTLAPGDGDVHTLTMTGVAMQTLYFSDRPARIAGAEPTELFAEKFTAAFADSPPNATLIGHLAAGATEEEAVVLTLLSVAWDAAAATLTYEVQLIDAEVVRDHQFEREPLSVLDATRDYAEAHLFIDDDEDLAICLTICVATGVILAPIFLATCAACAVT